MTSPALTESDPISPRAEALEDPLQYIPGTKTPPSWRLGGASAKSECPLHQDNDGQGASRPATVDQPQDSDQHPSLISRPAQARLMGDPLPIHARHAPHPRLAPGVLTHPWRAAPGPPRRGRSGSCSWPWRPAPNFPTRRAPGFRGWTAAGRASTCHPQRAWHPLSESPGQLSETRG